MWAVFLFSAKGRSLYDVYNFIFIIGNAVNVSVFRIDSFVLFEKFFKEKGVKFVPELRTDEYNRCLWNFARLDEGYDFKEFGNPFILSQAKVNLFFAKKNLEPATKRALVKAVEKLKKKKIIQQILIKYKSDIHLNKA